jgi:hypothetical protein
MQEVHLIDSITILQYTKAGLLRVKYFELRADEKPEISFPLSDLKS